MNDFEYDCLQKKRIAQQAKYRKCGSKSKKCRMSTDYMTHKQWKERNGKVVSINLNQPISWETFKTLSKSTQEEYLQSLMADYNVNATSLADMFNVRPLTIRRLIQQNGLNVKFQVGHSMNATQRKMWSQFISGGTAVKQEIKLSEERKNVTTVPLNRPSCPPVQKIIEQSKSEKMNMQKVSLSFCGQINVQTIANSLSQILGEDSIGEIEIVCNLQQ